MKYKLMQDYVFTDHFTSSGPFGSRKFRAFQTIASNHDLVLLVEELGNDLDTSTIWIWEKKPSLKTSQGVLKILQKCLLQDQIMVNLQEDPQMNFICIY